MIKRRINRDHKKVKFDESGNSDLVEIIALVLRPAKAHLDSSYLGKGSSINRVEARAMRRVIAQVYTQACSKEALERGLLRNLSISFPEILSDEVDSTFIFKINERR